MYEDYRQRAQKRADSLSFGLPLVAGILNDIHSVGEHGLIYQIKCFPRRVIYVWSMLDYGQIVLA